MAEKRVLDKSPESDNRAYPDRYLVEFTVVYWFMSTLRAGSMMKRGGWDVRFEWTAWTVVMPLLFIIFVLLFQFKNDQPVFRRSTVIVSILLIVANALFVAGAFFWGHPEFYLN